MKYRILHIIDSLAIGGTERQTVLNLSALDQTRFENFLCYLSPAHDLVDDVRNLGIQVSCLGINGKKEWLSGIIQLMRFIKNMKIDLVHTNLFEADVLGGIAARLSGIPVISTLTSAADKDLQFLRELHLNRYKLGLARYLRRTSQKLCHSRFIAVSGQVKESWIHRLGINEERIIVIPRAVSRSFLQSESSFVANEARTELSLDSSYPILLNVGRLIPQKGQKHILQAMPSILEHFNRAKLLIAGEGPIRGELEKLVEDLNLKDVVTFLGTSKQIKRLLIASDIFVLPSLSEGMPGALLEAAALGKPCIASDIESVREIIEDGESGLLVASGSPQALAQAVIRLGSNKEEVQKMGQHAHDTILNKFLIDKTIKKLESVYTQILSSLTA